MPVNAEKEKPGKRDEDYGAIDVAALMEQVRLETPQGTVTVSGIVKALWPWPDEQQPRRVYGNLQSFDKQSIMSFQCPAATAPGLLEEHVLLRGTLTTKKSTKHRGFDLELVGSKIYGWALSEPAITPLTALKSTRAKIPLERFLSSDAVKRLVLIGTETATVDVKHTLSRGSPKQSVDTRVSTTGLDKLKTVITESAQKYDGLCLVRGGGPSDSFATWNDSRLIAALIDCGKPFYTALGHSTDYTLADMYADESFGNPSDFASACTGAWKAREEREQLQRRYDNLSRAHQQLKAESAGEKSLGLNRNMDVLQTAIAKLQQLPATLEKQTSQYMSMAVKTTIQDDVSRPIAAAVKGSIADLNQATHNAREVLIKVTKKSRFHTWTWLFSAFLLGVLIGGFGFYRIELSKIDNIQSQLGIIQQQTTPIAPAPESKSTYGKSAKGRREH